jgi:hypothetical protein
MSVLSKSPAAAAILVAAVGLATWWYWPGPKHPTPPSGVRFGPRYIAGFGSDHYFKDGGESDEEIVGSERVVVDFIIAVRSRKADAVQALTAGSAAETAGPARTLAEQYADLLAGTVNVIFNQAHHDSSRDACLNFPRYPYQLLVDVVKGHQGTDSKHWLVDLPLKEPSPVLKPGTPAPPPHYDPDGSCQDGYAMLGIF